MPEPDSKNFVFIVKKTYELDEVEISQINDLYNDIFKDNILKTRNKNEFLEKFTSNQKKYSFHGIMKINGKIIGSYPVIPNKFNYFGKDLFFGLVVDTSINREYQGDLDNLQTLSNLVYKKLVDEKIYFIYGIANKSYYPIVKKLFSFKDICILNYFVKPISIKQKFSIVFIFNFFLYVLNFFRNIFSFSNSSEVIKKNIFHDKITFELSNFKNFNNVEIIKEENFIFAYKFILERKFNLKVKNLYIFDIYPFSKRNIYNVIKHCEKVFDDIEFIIFPHNGKEKSSNLFLTPQFIIKNKTIVSGKILEKTIINDEIFDSKNWNLNLSSFDIK